MSLSRVGVRRGIRNRRAIPFPLAEAANTFPVLFCLGVIFIWVLLQGFVRVAPWGYAGVRVFGCDENAFLI